MIPSNLGQCFCSVLLGYYGDRVFSAIGDILAMSLGFVIAWKLPPRVTAVGAILTDLILLFVIHDSLAVNIIMLIHPIEAIRPWQMSGHFQTAR